MQLIEQGPERLILRQTHYILALSLLCFTAFSVIFFINMLIQGPRYFSSMNAFQLLSYILWLGFALALIYLGSTALRQAAQGRRCTFDKTLETVTIIRPRLLRAQVMEYSIYGVSHVDVEHNAELRAYALFLVLRSGLRIPLASVPAHDHEAVRQVSQQIRFFLRNAAA